MNSIQIFKKKLFLNYLRIICFEITLYLSEMCQTDSDKCVFIFISVYIEYTT